MPATKNAMTRYQMIDTMLANRNRAYSIQDITDELGEKLREFGQEAVSKRCVEKDLNYLAYDSRFFISWIGILELPFCEKKGDSRAPFN
jgi:hypothetical protein